MKSAPDVNPGLLATWPARVDPADFRFILRNGIFKPVRLVFLVAVALPCFSQPANPRSLLNEVAAAAANATGWRIEGTMEEKTGGETYTTEFRLSQEPIVGFVLSSQTVTHPV